MASDRIREILRLVEAGELPAEKAYESLKTLPFEDMGFARLDHHRVLRKGYPEVIYCSGKTSSRIKAIAESFVEKRINMLLTRAGEDVYDVVREIEPEAEYNRDARAIWKIYNPLPKSVKPVLVITAGTSDIPVAEEACVTAETMGCGVKRLYDAGVAGIHRVFHNHEEIESAGSIVVVAGMEGALASVVGGLTGRPVVAVPTSVGYGASFNGLSALLGMLNSCSPGVAVVNIDNGFGAGYFAAVVCRESGVEEVV
ncbi:MAG TPA: nickel pincer cofactor biosynthesis protein LarB [bacterium]|nr:nickel pincer cofactor biosynthesis protein LarB [bacterium]